MYKALIKNGTIYTMASDGILKETDILIEDGIIAEIGKGLSLEEGDVYDVNGAMVLPGLIDAHCHIGLREEGISSSIDSVNEIGDPITPELRVIDGINPVDFAMVDAYSNGITTVSIAPGSANVMGGQFSVLKTFGNRVDHMILDEKNGIKVSLGENPISVYGGKGESPSTRMAVASLLRETILKAEQYAEEQNTVIEVENGSGIVKTDYNPKMEALIDVIEGNIPLRVHAHRMDDIFTAIRIAREFSIDIVLEHCTEGHLIAEQLAAEGFPVVFGPAFTDRSKYELRNLSFKGAKELVEKGVKLAFMTDAPEVPVQYLPICAGLAVREGLDEYEAFKCITINPAEILGISDRVGSIEVGKDADIAIFNGNPIRDLYARNILTLINGFAVHIEGAEKQVQDSSDLK